MGLNYFRRMNFILTVPEKRKEFLEELIKALPLLKERAISAEKAERVNDMLDVIQEMKAIEVNKVRQLERMLKTHFNCLRVPGGGNIGKAQVVSYMHKLKNVEVDHDALATLLPAAQEELAH